jgi:hypothetical protein
MWVPAGLAGRINDVAPYPLPEDKKGNHARHGQRDYIIHLLEGGTYIGARPGLCSVFHKQKTQQESNAPKSAHLSFHINYQFFVNVR